MGDSIFNASRPSRALQSAAVSIARPGTSPPDNIKALPDARRDALHERMFRVPQRAEAAVHRLGCLDNLATVHMCKSLMSKADTQDGHMRQLLKYIQAHTC
eukprot:366485-Chlamydomonas_euryale.AAC.16